METARIAKARNYAFVLHDGQMYGTMPYCFHLMDVVKVLLRFGYDKEEMIMAGYLHDVVEDCGVTVESVEQTFGSDTAKLVDAVTGIGRSRKERKLTTIQKLIDYPKAVPLKMADRLANMTNCLNTNSPLLKMYIKELPEYALMFQEASIPMWMEMQEISSKAD